MDLANICTSFPILTQSIRGKPLVYLDNGATTQKPRSVIDAITRYYENNNANVHRAPHALAQQATAAYESARQAARRFLGARYEDEIIHTWGTTHGINLIAHTWGETFVTDGDEIVLSQLEHHSNIVPWQLLAQRKKAVIRVAKICDNAEIDRAEFEKLLSSRTKIVALTHASNALGIIQPVEQLIASIRKKAPNAVVLIDGAQWVGHRATDVVQMDCDFYCLSGHKMYGPTGTGILFGKKELLDQMPPFFGGGDMVTHVSFERTTYASSPARFEAGTPHIAGTVGLGAAIEFINTLDWEAVHREELRLLHRLYTGLKTFDQVRSFGCEEKNIGIVSFIVKGESALDTAIKLSSFGIAVRAGHHCCMPLMQHFGIPGTVRASIAMYNTETDIDRFLEAMDLIVRPLHTSVYKAPKQNPEFTFGPFPTVSIEESVTEVRQELNECASAEERQELLMQLGSTHPHRLAALRTMVEPLQGCMSEVRIKTERTPDGRLLIASDSNSELLRGVLHIIERCFSGHFVHDLQRYHPKTLLTKLQFVDFISIQRRSGLSSLLRQLELALA